MNGTKPNGVKKRTIYPMLQRCRICGREDKKLFDIFDETLQLEEKIHKLLPIVVLPWDPLPHKSCQSCIDRLNFFNNFYDDSLKAETFLRTFYPSAPTNEPDLNVEPMIEINDCMSLLGRNAKSARQRSKLANAEPEYAHEEVTETRNDNAESAIEPEQLESSTENKEPETEKVAKIGGGDESAVNNKTIDCFIVTPVTATESVFTCRECFRTFTKQSSALGHDCYRTESGGQVETDENAKKSRRKSVPPLRIRLFSNNSNKYVCHLCKVSFSKKSHVRDHLRNHWNDGSLSEKSIVIKKVKKKKWKCRYEDKPSELVRMASPSPMAMFGT